ncbi:unnamed protein product, partial [Staurois parvus]
RAAFQCCLLVPVSADYQCHQCCLSVPVGAIYHYQSVTPISAVHQCCPSVPPNSSNQCRLSVPYMSASF